MAKVLKVRNSTNTAWETIAVELPDMTGYASETYVDNAVAAATASLVDAAPSTLNTLNELAAALNDDDNFATTVTNQIATKASTGKAIAMAIVFGG